MTLQHTIKAVVRQGEQSGYVAECLEIPVVTQGQTLDEVTRNLREAVELHLEGEDLPRLRRLSGQEVVAILRMEQSERRNFPNLIPAVSDGGQAQWPRAARTCLPSGPVAPRAWQRPIAGASHHRPGARSGLRL